MSTLAIAVFSGCAPSQPFRTTLVNPGQIECPREVAATSEQCASVTPEISRNAYELHFVEFDDQGWAYIQPADENRPDGHEKWNQIDHLMDRLKDLLETEKEDVSIVLYVHGWLHRAKSDDGDVIRFRDLLQSVSNREHAHAPRGKARKVVGIYVGWRGKSWDLPDPLLGLTFWSRKAAALRISHGSVQELFSRLRAMQQVYNSNPDCVEVKSAKSATGQCRIRSLMVGHSFGAWILYSAVSGPLIEVLNAYRDSRNEKTGNDARSGNSMVRLREDKATQMRAQRLADMIVLVNPAFEASRYEPLHQAAISYRPTILQPPLLVSITSTADQATRTAFPIGRFFNTLFEHPVTSENQAVAMKRTPGHIEHYLTHRLTKTDEKTCSGWTPPGSLDSGDGDVMRKNKEIEAGHTFLFFKKNSDSNGLLRAGWKRTFCGGASLVQLNDALHENNNPNSLVWNIQTDASLIRSHSDIMEPAFLEFVRQLYDDTTIRNPK